MTSVRGYTRPGCLVRTFRHLPATPPQRYCVPSQELTWPKMSALLETSNKTANILQLPSRQRVPCNAQIPTKLCSCHVVPCGLIIKLAPSHLLIADFMEVKLLRACGAFGSKQTRSYPGHVKSCFVASALCSDSQNTAHLVAYPPASNKAKRDTLGVTLETPLKAVNRGPAYVGRLYASVFGRIQKKHTYAEKTDRLVLLFRPRS
jgi:hypothetical protein